MPGTRAVTALLIALLIALASTATLTANAGVADGNAQDTPSAIDSDCRSWRVSFANAITGDRAAVDFTAYENALRFRDGLCGGRTPFPIAVDVQGPECIGADVRVRVLHENPDQVRADGHPVAPLWSVRIEPWDAERFGGSGGHVFYLWQGFQGRDAEEFARSLASRVVENLRSQGYGVAVYGVELGRSG